MSGITSVKSAGDDLPPRIALIGIMGSGKTTTGRHLARVLGYDFIDMDRIIVQETGKTVAALFETRGESGFRRLEAALLRKLSRRKSVVVSTGGGIVLEAGNRLLLRKSFTTIWLRVPAAEARRRIGGAKNRPLLSGTAGDLRLSRLRSLARMRAPLYAATGASVRTTGKSPDELARVIARKLGVPR